MAHCPECDGKLTIKDDTKVGELLTCPECQAQLEVLSLSPTRLVLAPEIEEDWGE